MSRRGDRKGFLSKTRKKRDIVVTGFFIVVVVISKVVMKVYWMKKLVQKK